MQKTKSKKKQRNLKKTKKFLKKKKKERPLFQLIRIKELLVPTFSHSLD